MSISTTPVSASGFFTAHWSPHGPPKSCRTRCARSTPLLYKIATLWAALEGSIILWTLVLAGYGVAVVRRFRSQRDDKLEAWAVLVLPATTFLEHDDIYTAGGHTFLQIGRAVLPPHAECRSNHDVICGLARRLGARHPGFAMTAFAPQRC